MNSETGKQYLLTIGVMVYNEEKYLAETVASILKQDFKDFEIVIADNASDDSTGEIAIQLAASDSRIRYHRHAQNIGASKNFNFLVKNASGKYFVLAGGHDLWSPNYLSALVDALESTPTAVLAYGRTVWIDSAGTPLKTRSGFIDTSGLGTLARFNLVMWGNQNAMYGMFNLDALHKTRLHIEIVGADLVLLGELALQGDFIVVPEVTWFRRMNRQPENREERLRRYYRILFSKRRPIILPHWKITPAYITSVLREKMPFDLRLKLVLSASTSLIQYGTEMVKDIKLFFQRIRYKQEDSK